MTPRPLPSHSLFRFHWGYGNGESILVAGASSPLFGKKERVGSPRYKDSHFAGSRILAAHDALEGLEIRLHRGGWIFCGGV